eukprot:5362064-Lingulodinium_polyedra.AAC.1
MDRARGEMLLSWGPEARAAGALELAARRALAAGVSGAADPGPPPPCLTSRAWPPLATLRPRA